MRTDISFRPPDRGEIPLACAGGSGDLLVISHSASKLKDVVASLAAPAPSEFFVTTTADVQSAMALLAHRRFAALLYDSCNDAGAYLHVVPRLQIAAPETAILVLAGGEEPFLARQVLACGAQECVLPSDCAPASLGRLVRNAIERQAFERANQLG